MYPHALPNSYLPPQRTDSLQIDPALLAPKLVLIKNSSSDMESSFNQSALPAQQELISRGSPVQGLDFPTPPKTASNSALKHSPQRQLAHKLSASSSLARSLDNISTDLQNHNTTGNSASDLSKDQGCSASPSLAGDGLFQGRNIPTTGPISPVTPTSTRSNTSNTSINNFPSTPDLALNNINYDRDHLPTNPAFTENSTPIVNRRVTISNNQLRATIENQQRQLKDVFPTQNNSHSHLPLRTSHSATNLYNRHHFLKNSNHNNECADDIRDQLPHRQPPFSPKGATAQSESSNNHPDLAQCGVSPSVTNGLASSVSFNQPGTGPVATEARPHEFGEEWMEAQAGDCDEARPHGGWAADMDYSYSIRQLMNEHVFEELLDDPLGRHRLRDWIGHQPSPVAAAAGIARLDMWLDCRSLGQHLDALKTGAVGVHDIYLTPGSSGAVCLPEQDAHSLTLAVEDIVRVRSSAPSIQTVERWLLRSLYQHEFQRFIQHSLVTKAKVRLGKFNLSDADRDGLGDCFCLTNPRMRDHPIVLVSEGFTRVTGYDRSSIVGKNCRFLQGPGTAPQSVQRIRDGLNSGEGCTELLLNYRYDGTPFYCLLCILPLRDTVGSLVYFIGGQVNVTGLLSGKKGLSFLIADPEGDSSELTVPIGSGEQGPSKYVQSQSMQRYTGSGAASMRAEGSICSDQRLALPGDGHAAGSITFDGSRAGPLGEDSISRKRGFLRRLAGGGAHQRDPAAAGMRTLVSSAEQKLVGAESQLADPKPLAEQVKVFEATYAKLVIFKRDNQKVIFATKELIKFFGLGVANWKEVYRSKVLGSDFVELVWSLTPTIKESVIAIRNQLKKMIKLGAPISLECQVKAVERSFFLGKEEKLAKLKSTKIHLTPLLEKDGQIVAYVCVFG